MTKVEPLDNSGLVTVQTAEERIAKLEKSLEQVATAEERIAKLEKSLEQVATVTMQIMGVLEKQGQLQDTQKDFGPSKPQTIQMLPPPQQPPGGNVLAQLIGPIAKIAEGIFAGPAQPAQPDFFEAEMMKGMKDSFVAGFKSYIQNVNQDAEIGRQVIEAIKRGGLKLEAGTAEATVK